MAESLGVGVGTISGILQRATEAELDWPMAQAMTEAALEARLYRRPSASRIDSESIEVMSDFVT